MQTNFESQNTEAEIGGEAFKFGSSLQALGAQEFPKFRADAEAENLMKDGRRMRNKFEAFSEYSVDLNVDRILLNTSRSANLKSFLSSGFREG